MKERICTLMWGTAWQDYGENFARTFEEFWPSDVELVIVTDRRLPTQRPQQIDLKKIPGYASFISKYGADPKANGYGGKNRKNIARYAGDIESRDWRYDAVLWAPQILTPRASINGLDDGDILAWFDADVETIAAVPKMWLSAILGKNDIAVMQRDRQNSELGFWAVRISIRTRRFLTNMGNVYESGDVFGLQQWHSGFVFDHVLASSGLKIKNLTPPRFERMTGGSIWWRTALGEYTNHLKGKLKFMPKRRRNRLIEKKRKNSSQPYRLPYPGSK